MTETHLMAPSHPITPPPELVQQWAFEWMRSEDSRNLIDGRDNFMAAHAAQWGADQELEACLRLVEIDAGEDAYDFARYIRAARRPKPPSAVAQAEALIERYEDGWCPSPGQWHVIREGLAEGRRALEQLDD